MFDSLIGFLAKIELAANIFFLLLLVGILAAFLVIVRRREPLVKATHFAGLTLLFVLLMFVLSVLVSLNLLPKVQAPLPSTPKPTVIAKPTKPAHTKPPSRPQPVVVTPTPEPTFKEVVAESAADYVVKSDFALEIEWYTEFKAGLMATRMNRQLVFITTTFNGEATDLSMAIKEQEVYPWPKHRRGEKRLKKTLQLSTDEQAIKDGTYELTVHYYSFAKPAVTVDLTVIVDGESKKVDYKAIEAAKQDYPALSQGEKYYDGKYEVFKLVVRKVSE